MRYDFGPLERAVGGPDDQIAEACDVVRRTVQRWRTTGLSYESAVAACEAARLHPAELWPSWYSDELERLSRTCAAPGCDATFLPENPRRKYCCRTCGQNVAKAKWKRRRYAEDPSYAEARRADSARYYAEARTYVRRRQNLARGHSVDHLERT